MQPQDVHSKKFHLINVLFNFDDFSIAHGQWEDGNDVIGMRYNETDSSSIGYPNTFGRPNWFVVSSDIAKIVLTGLLNFNLLKKEEHENILKTLTLKNFEPA